MEFSQFINSFNEDSNIPTIDKFNCLQNCLSGQTLTLLEPFQVVESNNKLPLDRLKERYDNKTLIFLDNINSLFSIATMSEPNALSLRSILDKYCFHWILS